MILNQKKPENFHLKKIRPQFSDRDRLLLETKYLLEKTDEEISEEFGISVNSVRSILSRARKRTYRLLQKE